MTEIEIYKQSSEDEECLFASCWNAKVENLTDALMYIKCYLSFLWDRKEVNAIHIRVLTPTLEIRKDYLRTPTLFKSTACKYSGRR